jgi:hypothetical protein
MINISSSIGFRATPRSQSTACWKEEFKKLVRVVQFQSDRCDCEAFGPDADAAIVGDI